MELRGTESSLLNLAVWQGSRLTFYLAHWSSLTYTKEYSRNHLRGLTLGGDFFFLLLLLFVYAGLKQGYYWDSSQHYSMLLTDHSEVVLLLLSWMNEVYLWMPHVKNTAFHCCSSFIPICEFSVNTDLIVFVCNRKDQSLTDGLQESCSIWD